MYHHSTQLFSQNLIEASKAQMEVIIVDEKQTLQEKEKVGAL